MTRRGIFAPSSISTPNSFSTSFALTENPIVEGGVWQRGGVEGLDWQNPRTANGRAYADGTTADGTFTDPIAHLKSASFSIGANHGCEATIYRESGYTPPSSHEVELHLRWLTTANSARGYEILFGFNGSGVQLVRWNGPLGDYTVNSGTISFPSAIVHGNRIKATCVGSTITVYTMQGSDVDFVQRGTLSLTANEWSSGNVWNTGMPGMGFFVRPGGTPESYAISDYAAYNV